MNTVEKTFDLQPINGRKSFYKKATVTQLDNISTLTSYGTKVATYNSDTNKVEIIGWFSATTATHINAFLDFYGFNTQTKKELQNSARQQQNKTN